jgi:glycosyltransferase involved in cell wall biosynthesis
MKLSIVIPVYNEKNTIVELLDRVVHSPVKMDYEIVVVDDGSKDGTSAILDDYKAKFDKSGYGTKLKLFHKENGGKGSAVYMGLKEATGDIIGIQDADLEYFPEDYPLILEPMKSGITRVCYGSRFMFRWIPQGMTLKNWIGNMVLNMTAWILYGFGSTTDLATCYKFWFREDIPAEELVCKGFEFCPVQFAAAYHRGLKVYEVPIRFHARWYKEGKKIMTADGFYELWTLIKLRFKNAR